VIETITTWLGDIETVNLFLERAPKLRTTDLKTEAQIAWNRAEDEPAQLSSLSSLPGLSKAGQNAARDLANVFAAVPDNLTDIIVNAGKKGVVKRDLDNISDLRCNTVLPNVEILWAEAAKLAKWPDAPMCRVRLLARIRINS
jgi:hypothetical protein